MTCAGSLEAISLWNAGLSSDEKHAVRKVLISLIRQARATSQDGARALARLGYKATIRNRRMLSLAVGGLRGSSHWDHYFHDLYPDPVESDLNLLFSVFALADTHRRLYECAGACTHPWHNLPPIE